MKNDKRGDIILLFVCPLYSSSFFVHAYDFKTHAHAIKTFSFDLAKGQPSYMHKLKTTEHEFGR